MVNGNTKDTDYLFIQFLNVKVDLRDTVILMRDHSSHETMLDVYVRQETNSKVSH